MLLALVSTACEAASGSDAESGVESGSSGCDPIEAPIGAGVVIEPYGLTAEQLAADFLIDWEGEGVWQTSDLVDSVPWNEPSLVSLTHSEHAYTLETQCETRRLLVDTTLTLHVDEAVVLEKASRASGGLRREDESWDEVPGFLELVEVREELEGVGVAFASFDEGALGATLVVRFLPDSKEVSVLAKHSVVVAEGLEMSQTRTVLEAPLSPSEG